MNPGKTKLPTSNLLLMAFILLFLLIGTLFLVKALLNVFG